MVRDTLTEWIRGWNIQAYIAYICGAIIPFPGFCGSLGASVSETATNLGHIGWCLSFVVSIVVYAAICRVWPTQNQKAMKGMNLKWEQMATESVEGQIPHYKEYNEAAVVSAKTHDEATLESKEINSEEVQVKNVGPYEA